MPELHPPSSATQPLSPLGGQGCRWDDWRVDSSFDHPDAFHHQGRTRTYPRVGSKTSVGGALLCMPGGRQAISGWTAPPGSPHAGQA